MGETTIEWTATYNDNGTISPGYTFNPWIGCQEESPGCAHCYAKTFFTRKPRWANTWGSPERSERLRTSDTNWRLPLKWDREAKAEGVRRKVFCASASDLFEDNNQVIPWRRELLSLVCQTPNLDWLLLTKRIENVLRMVPTQWTPHKFGSLPFNVWIGTSVENQEMANKRIPALLKIPAIFHFLSIEPLLGAIDLEKVFPNGRDPQTFSEVDWVIVGGESGPGARPMHPDWVRDLRDRCLRARVAFFFKQWGTIWQWDDPPTLVVSDKKAAGRILDGRQWSEMPELETA